MKKLFITMGLTLAVALSNQAAVVEYWNFEDGVADKNFTPSGTPNGTGGSTGTNGTLMRGWDASFGPAWAGSSLPNGGLLMMDCDAASKDGYTTEGALHNWTSPEWTLEIQVKFDDFGSGWCTMIGRDGSSFGVNESDFYFQRSGDDGTIRIQYPRADATDYRNGINSLNSSTVILPGRWYGIAVTCDANRLAIWLDDGSGYVLDASTDVSANANNGIYPSTLNWVFGRGWYNGHADRTDAQYDNIRFSNTALSPDQFIALNPAGTRLTGNTGIKPLAPLDWPKEQPAEAPEFYLASETWTRNFNDHTGCQILRELIRQSLLVSAELDRGCIPRDEAMGDPAPANSILPELSLNCEFAERAFFKYQIGLKDQQTPLVSKSIPSYYYDVSVYTNVLVTAERQARELIAPETSKKTPLPESSNAGFYDIKNMDFLTLWKQLREWDEEIRTYGETPERLSALARGYSTLGMTTYGTISSVPKACTARGLVYARRMAVKYPDNPLSYYTGAYAWTLAGMETPARSNLQKAQQLEGNPPSWTDVLCAYLDSDLDILREQMELPGFDGQLAGMLGAFATHNHDFSDRFILFAEPALEKNPQNIQFIHLYNGTIGELGTKGWASSAGFDLMDSMLSQRLFKIHRNEEKYDVFGFALQHVTESGKTLHAAGTANPLQYPVLFSELMEQQESDRHSLSSATLAHLIRDNRFTLTYYRLHYLKFSLAVNADNALTELLPQVANHPYAPLLKTFATGADVRAITKEIKLGSPSQNLTDFLINRIMSNKEPAFADMDYGTARLTAFNNSDRNGFDYVRYLYEENRANKYYKMVLAACPTHYIGIMFALLDNDLPTDDFVREHKELIESSAIGTYFLGKHYAENNQPELAREMYEKSVAIKPTLKAMRDLAEISLQQGDTETWLKYMIASLEIPNQGLRSARTKIMISDEFMKRGDWEKGLQFANDAAGCYSQWALDSATWANGLVGNKDRALGYIIACYKRYSETDELFNLLYILELPYSDEANQCLDDLYQRYLRENEGFDLLNAACLCLTRNNPEDAVTQAENSLRVSNDPWGGLLGALICEDQGWIERRDQILAETLARFPDMKNPSNNRKGLHSLVELYTEINKTNTLTPKQIEAINAFAERFPREGFNVDAHAFAGELLRLKGRKDLAEKMFSDLIDTKYRMRTIEFLPYMRLREMGIDPIQLLRERTGAQIKIQGE